MKLLQRTMVALAGVAALATVSVPEARADILPTTVNARTITPLGGGLFRWDYAILLSSAQNANSSHFFIIYDFGQATNVLVPAGWGASYDAFNRTPGNNGNRGAASLNRAEALNLILLTINGQDNGQPQLGTASVTSTGGSQQAAAFVGDGNISNALVATAAPEPASLVLLGTGMLGIVGVARRRKK